jgi:hypothetical protein
MTRKTDASATKVGAKRSPRKSPPARPRTTRPREVSSASEDNPAVEELEPSPAENVADQIDPELRHRMISEAAFARYAARDYADGYDFEDWLEAEAAVDHMLQR